jgi:putative ABC transport system ATP-binding protein
MAVGMIRVRDLVMRLSSGGRPVTILAGVSLDVAAGEVVAVTGPSGSGKSTLLGLIAGLDTPTAGSVVVDGVELAGLGETELARFRHRTVGFVFQSYHLIPTLTAAENVAVPLELARVSRAVAAARDRLAEVGLAERAEHYPAQLSGGEQQRVAIARAMALSPPLLLADEPTGSVDTRTGNMIFEMFHQIRDTYGTTIIIVTHDISVMAKVDRTVAIRDGKTSSELVRRVNLNEVQEVDGRSQVVLGETHEEFTVLDSAGRLQIPRDYMERLGLKGRVVVEMDGDQIVVRKAEN